MFGISLVIKKVSVVSSEHRRKRVRIQVVLLGINILMKSRTYPQLYYQYSSSTIIAFIFSFFLSLTDMTTPGQSGPRSDGNEEEIHIPHRSMRLSSVIQDTRWGSLTLLQGCTRCILQPQSFYNDDFNIKLPMKFHIPLDKKRMPVSLIENCSEFWNFNQLIMITFCSTSKRVAGGSLSKEFTRGVMVIVVGNGHGNTSSNPGRDWLHLT